MTPTQIIDLKGLMGDKSDNIPGVPGIGEKTGIKLIKEFSSIEGIFDNIVFRLMWFWIYLHKQSIYYPTLDIDDLVEYKVPRYSPVRKWSINAF